MNTRIKLTEDNFELPEPIHYTKDEDVILGIRLFNLTLAKKVVKQILENQEFRKKHDRRFAGLRYLEELKQENKKLKEDYDKLDKLHEKITLKKHEYHQLNLNLKQKLEKFTNMIYHAECGRLPNNWIKQGREILDDGYEWKEGTRKLNKLLDGDSIS